MKTWKVVKSPKYNYVFNTKTGFFARWGETKEDDPDFSPFGPEILDIEISTICHQGCSFCYKTNTAKGKNMSLDTFKQIFAKMPPNLTQIAFGIGSIDANPDLFPIMAHTRKMGIIPNITINGYRMKNQHYRGLASFCGAVAVSNYDKDVCYQTVEDLNWYKKENPTSTLRQINIHQVLSEESVGQCFELMHDMQTDSRLSELNAVVFLLLKPKGGRNVSHQLRNSTKYKALIDYAMAKKLPIGFDSCSAPSFLRAIKDYDETLRKQLEQVAEPCESTMFSLYVNVNGEAVPCSFCDGEKGMMPIDMLSVENFMKEVWGAYSTVAFRIKLLDSQEKYGCRQCPVFDVEINQDNAQEICCGGKP